jgi:hypothetical protein
MSMFRKRRSNAAVPGLWYGSYHAAWSHAFPDRFGAGGFCAGDVWSTATPEWDRAWFEGVGMSMPEKVRAAGEPVPVKYARLIPVDETARRSARQYRDAYPGNFAPEDEWPSTML